MTHRVPGRWVQNLPRILLGIICTIKKDLGFTPAELVYGTTLRLPGQFFELTLESNVDLSSDYVSNLRMLMSSLAALTQRSQQKPAYVLKDLQTCSHVVLRTDSVRGPLQPPCEGPFRVLRHGDKQFTIDHDGKTDMMSIDRVKPAYTDDEIPKSTETLILPYPIIETSDGEEVDVFDAETITQQTRSGCCITWPDRYLQSHF